MRLIPGKTKVKIELFRKVTLSDVIVGLIGLIAVTLCVVSSLPGRWIIAMVVLAIFALMLFRLDEEPMYVFVWHMLRYRAYPRRFSRVFDDKLLLKGYDYAVDVMYNEKKEAVTTLMGEEAAEAFMAESATGEASGETTPDETASTNGETAEAGSETAEATEEAGAVDDSSEEKSDAYDPETDIQNEELGFVADILNDLAETYGGDDENTAEEASEAATKSLAEASEGTETIEAVSEASEEQAEEAGSGKGKKKAKKNKKADKKGKSADKASDTAKNAADSAVKTAESTAAKAAEGAAAKPVVTTKVKITVPAEVKAAYASATNEKDKKKALKKLIAEENKVLGNKKASEEDKNAVWLARAERSAERKQEKAKKKDENAH